jgi:hypothetical protein
MFLRDNFIHGDMHSGNILYDEDRRVVTVMDAGLVTHLPGDVWNEFGDFIRALVSKDISEVCYASTIRPACSHIAGGASSLSMFSYRKCANISIARLTPLRCVCVCVCVCVRVCVCQMRDKLILFHDENVIGAIPRKSIDPVYLHKDLDDIYLTGGGSNRGPDIPLAQALGDIIGDVLKRLGRHGIVLRSDVASAICSISVAEGVIFQLDPELDVLKAALPYFVKYQVRTLFQHSPVSPLHSAWAAARPLHVHPARVPTLAPMHPPICTTRTHTHTHTHARTRTHTHTHAHTHTHSHTHTHTHTYTCTRDGRLQRSCCLLVTSPLSARQRTSLRLSPPRSALVKTLAACHLVCICEPSGVREYGRRVW